MAASFTTTELLAAIKRHAMIPTSQSTFTASDLLAFADNEINNFLLPKLISAREDFYLTETGATQSITANQRTYPIPYRAVGMMVKDVIRIDSAGSLYSLSLIEYDLLAERDISSTGTPGGFHFENNKIALIPTPGATTGSLKTPYFIRPSKLIETSDAVQITVIDTGTNTVTVSAVPATMTTSTPLDLIRQKGGFECLAIDQTPSAVTGTTIQFSSLPSDLAVGDWIALAEKSPIPQIPAELHDLLALRVARRVLMSLGDANALKMVDKMLDETQGETLKLTEPRAQGEARKIITRRWWRS